MFSGGLVLALKHRNVVLEYGIGIKLLSLSLTTKGFKVINRHFSHAPWVVRRGDCKSPLSFLQHPRTTIGSLRAAELRENPFPCASIGSTLVEYSIDGRAVTYSGAVFKYDSNDRQPGGCLKLSWDRELASAVRYQQSRIDFRIGLDASS